MPTYTPNLRLHVPDFDQNPWDEAVNSNWYALDSAVGSGSGDANFTGVWKNSFAYAVGKTALDATDGSMWLVLEAHTSAPAPTLFADDRAAHPGTWIQIAGSGGGGGSTDMGWINVKEHGAVGDGITDDAPALNAIITSAPAGSTIFFPKGNYKVSSALNINKMLTLLGSGRLSSTLVTDQVAANILFITQPANITAIGFNCSVTATSGSLVTFNGSTATRGRLQSFWMSGFYNGINVNGTSDVMIIDGQMFNWSSTGQGIIYTGGEGMVIEDVIMQQGTRPGTGTGIAVYNGGMQLINSEILACGSCLALIPGSGQAVNSMWVMNTGFDNGRDGILIQPTGSGVVERCWFIGCWMSSHDNSGVTISCPSVGSVNGIDFNGCHVFDNKLHGFNMTDSGARNLNFLGCSIAGNTQTGIQFFNGGAQFQIANCVIGPYGGFGKNNAGGVNIGGSSISYRIMNNDLANGGTNSLVGAGVQSGSSPGISEFINGNIGYNSQSRGQATISTGALSVTVAHSLNGTPRLQDIELTPLTGLGNPPQAIPFVLSPTSTTFTIEIGVAVAFNIGVAWQARLPCSI